MSIMFADDFMGYGTNGGLLLNGLWGTASCGIVASPDPNDAAGTKALQFIGYGNGARRPFAVGSVATAGCALRLWLPVLPYYSTGCIRFLDAGNAVQANMFIVPNGAIGVAKGVVSDANTLAVTSVPVLVANAFNHIEFKVVCGIAGSFEVRVNGTPVLSMTGVDVGTAFQLGLGTTNDINGTSSRTDFIKDLVTWNGSGARNNDFLGTVSVLGMTPSSDVSLGWTPSSGLTGWNLLDNSPPVDGVDYLTAPYPAPPPSVFGLTNLPINVTSVRAMIAQTRARKVDGGDGNLQSSLLSDVDTVNGADRPITTAFTYYEDVFETDPHTGTAWTPAAANAAKLKINRTV